MSIYSYPSEGEKELSRSIKAMRDAINEPLLLVTSDDIEQLFSDGIEEGTIDAHNYANFFVLLKDGCFNEDPDLGKFDRDRVHRMLGVFLCHFPEFIDQCNGVQAGIILFSLAKMSYDSNTDIIHSLLDRAAQRIRELDLWGIANILWAAAVLNKTNYPAIETFVEKANIQLDYLDPDDRNDSFTIDQLYRFHFVSGSLPAVEELFSRLPLPSENVRRDFIKVSQTQRYLYDAVRRALPEQIEMTLGKFIKEIRCELDIAVECGDLLFDIECDGPHHVFRRLADKLNDDMKSSKGWEVFRIDTRNDMFLHVLDEKIAPVISEIRRKLADVIPSLLDEHEAEPAHPAEPAPKPLCASPDPAQARRSIELLRELAYGETPTKSPQTDLPDLGQKAQKMRVYAIARQLGIDNRELVVFIKRLGIDILNHMSAVSLEDTKRIISTFYKSR